MTDRKTHHIRLGTAGWSYKDWEGIVYPKPKPKGFDPLCHLAQYIDCIEINSSFYHPPAEKNVRSWIKRVEPFPDFRFTLKLWQRFTHEREPFGRGEVAQMRIGADLMAEAGRLGTLLLQFPWSFKNTQDNRAWLVRLFEAFAGYPLALEVRHESWDKQQFYDFLEGFNAGFVNIDQPLFSGSLAPTTKATSAVGYVRLHGQNTGDWFRKEAGRDERYDYLYSAEELKPWAERVSSLAKTCPEVYVITNNHYKGQALANAIELKALVTEKPVTAPESLVLEYPGLGKIIGNE